jgi:ABC-2 type transport system permease protein
MTSRLGGIIAKEFIQLWRDKLALTLALFVPVAMLFIFGWAINTDVKHVPTVVFDQSGSVEAQALLEAFENSQYFDIRLWARNTRELTRLIDAGDAKVGVVIPPDFARRLARRATEIQVIVDASDPMVATSAMNAAAALAAQRSLEILTQTLEGVVIRMPPVDFRVRAWYNPDLVSAIFIVPGLVGALLMQTTITQMAVSIVREREKGTLEALIVSPIRRWELLLGKIIPNLLVAYGQMTGALLVAHFVFDVPIRGSLVLLYTLALLFMWGTLGIGIFVSAASRTVPQAMQLAFLTFLPSIYLSGLLFPVEGMPRAAQYLAHVIPLTYFLKIVRGIVLKGVGLELLLPNLLPLALFGAFVFSASILRFRKQLD